MNRDVQSLHFCYLASQLRRQQQQFPRNYVTHRSRSWGAEQTDEHTWTVKQSRPKILVVSHDKDKIFNRLLKSDQIIHLMTTLTHRALLLYEA